MRLSYRAAGRTQDMERTLTCDCGYVASDRDLDGLVAAVQGHAHAAHRVRLSRDLVLALSEREHRSRSETAKTGRDR